MTPYEQTAEIVEKISPILAGRQPEIVGAVLADLLAVYLASHMMVGDDGTPNFSETQKLREDLLTEHIKTVRALIPINEAILTGAPRRQ